jgi:Rrf2 family transcriptional regulator, iron-sulfur cluster assembly transcription factor
MTISAKSKYAVRALVELADRTDGATTVPVRLTEIAAARQIPLQFLEQVFAVLRRAGVVQSRRGARGGYVFARPPSEVTVLQVVVALDGPPAPALCTQGDCERSDDCGAASVWLEAKEALESVLEGTTIDDLVERERSSRARPRKVMYHI